MTTPIVSAETGQAARSARSRIFTAYNYARGYARRSGELDLARVNRALGIAQSATRLELAHRKYGSNIRFCGCPDSLYRHGVICYHRIGAMIERKAELLANSKKTWDLGNAAEPAGKGEDL